MHKLLQIFIILFLIYSNAWADRICLKIINGQEVYTNLCNRESKKKSIKKSVNYRMPAMSQTSSSISREELENIVEEKSKHYSMDSKLIKEMIREESAWNVNAISPKGAMGIMQLMPSTAMLMGVKNPYDPVENIDAGIRYMKYLLEKFNGDVNLALAAYNAGPNLVESLGRIPNIVETQNYVRRISLRYSGKVPEFSSYPGIKRSSPIKAVVLSDGTVVYTNREDIYIWSTKH
ncbi:MAG TPA: lytic transglycosylase domain-containing protein [Thermodesulfovibrio thiophilus]|uniref:lytic transglycosylase domain-containing protein n=1 Tax=Thermodesulfovibrio thiophilus TaxID=340095 RepID=UPI000A006ADB|nr:lytic transglycosylase domain-containing protein [Thermodesulfovibrio thiophilus]HQD37161.1 lytic transglycosylase domain-containing protein [Thermodesulfovibrio thiophilus]